MEKKQPATQRPTVLFSMILAVVASLVLAPCIHFSNRPFLARAAAAEQWSAAPAVVTAETGYYTDVDYDWIHNPGLLECGLRYFDQMTGVHPYVYILPNGTTTSTSDLRSCAEYLYSELFTDNRHFILVFCDDGEGDYNCDYAVGSQAKTIMDSEAISTLGDCLEHCYGDLSLSEEEIFSNAFIKTAEHIARADLALQMGGSDVVPDDCVEYGEYTYVILEDRTAKIVRWCGDDIVLEVPSSIDGRPVSSMGLLHLPVQLRRSLYPLRLRFLKAIRLPFAASSRRLRFEGARNPWWPSTGFFSIVGLVRFFAVRVPSRAWSIWSREIRYRLVSMRFTAARTSLLSA